jgi:hypothetical protein
MADNKLRLHSKLQRFLQRKESIMRAIGNNSVNFFKITVFNAQGWIYSGSTNRWAKRKDVKDRPDRKILVDTGAGRQSIHIYKLTSKSVIIRAEAEYMRYHNTGTDRMPQRKFMGHSVKLDKENIVILIKRMRGIL